jgi:peroxiredoxin
LTSPFLANWSSDVDTQRNQSDDVGTLQRSPGGTETVAPPEYRDGVAAERNPYVLPPDLPIPVDDGAADHLVGEAIPALSLPSTSDRPVDLATAARRILVLYLYPRTGRPGEELPEGWDDIPGARGCTPQSCAFRDHFAELQSLGADVLGLSAQGLADQVEFAQRVGLPYPILSDPQLELAKALRLPTFEVAGMRLYRRVTLIARKGRVDKVFHPVFPPDRNAADVAAWLAGADAT